MQHAAAGFRAFVQSPMVQVGRSARAGLDRSISVNERLQAALHPWSSFVVVPIFALANAGVDLRDGVLADALGSRLTWAVVVGLVVGKFLGIGVTAMLGARAGLGRLPAGVGPGHVFGGAALSGIGFTVSLLVVGLALDDPAAGPGDGRVLLAASATVLVGTFGRGGMAGRETRLPASWTAMWTPSRTSPGPGRRAVTLVRYGDSSARSRPAPGVAEELLRGSARPALRLPPPCRCRTCPAGRLASPAAVAADLQGGLWPITTCGSPPGDSTTTPRRLPHTSDWSQQFVRDLDDPTWPDGAGYVTSAEAPAPRDATFSSGREAIPGRGTSSPWRGEGTGAGGGGGHEPPQAPGRAAVGVTLDGHVGATGE